MLFLALIAANHVWMLEGGERPKQYLTGYINICRGHLLMHRFRE